MMSNGHVSDCRSKLRKQQPENGEALAVGPAATKGFVVKDGASHAAFEAAAEPVIYHAWQDNGRPT